MRSFLLLVTEQIQMMWNLTKAIVDPWMRPELVARVAEMLNYFLAQLVSNIGFLCSGVRVCLCAYVWARATDMLRYENKYLRVRRACESACVHARAEPLV